MKAKNRLAQLYKSFSLAEGSQYIASEYAIFKTHEIIKIFGTKSVLEVGLGIGSIAGTLLEVNDELSYTGTETNNFCLESLVKNLDKNYDRVEIYSDLKLIPEFKKFDLIIIDGKDPDLRFVKKILSKRGIIVVEGDRLDQQRVLQNVFPRSRMVHSISLMKNKSYSPFSSEQWQGGLKIIFINPSYFQYIWWLKEKISTKLKYQKRRSHLESSEN